MPWFEIAPGHSINIEQTWRVSLKNTKVEYYSANNDKTDIDYGTEAAAQLVYDAFLLVADPPKLIDTSTVIELRGDGNLRKSENLNYTVKFVPTEENPFWIIEGNDNGHLYIFPTMFEDIFEVVQP